MTKMLLVASMLVCGCAARGPSMETRDAGSISGERADAGEPALPCGERAEAECKGACFQIRAFGSSPLGGATRFVECSDQQLGGNAAITCGLSPDQRTCLRFTTTLIATGWTRAACEDPRCTPPASP